MNSMEYNLILGMLRVSTCTKVNFGFSCMYLIVINIVTIIIQVYLTVCFVSFVQFLLVDFNRV